MLDDPHPSPAGTAPSWQTHFAALAAYHLWALERLYEHIDRLPEDDYKRGAGLFFKSVHGTLNHLLVAEHRVWYPRFADGTSNRVELNAELEADRAALRKRLLAAAAQWQPRIASWPSARFDGRLDYTTTRGVAQSLPFALTLAHVFNHGTHHRGQISAALTAMGHQCPELDLVWMLQAQGRSE
ncbi:MAG: DinB family protein [Pseudomonadota bacterium]|nr:DinB family protein [Pseudomonadota bacterium]